MEFFINLKLSSGRKEILPSLSPLEYITAKHVRILVELSSFNNWQELPLPS